MAKTDFLTADMTRRQFMKISGKSLAGLTLSASMLSLFGCSQEQVDSGAVATWALPQGLLVVNADLCTGCQRCEINCTLTNDGVCSSYISRVKIQRRLNLDGAGNGLLSGTDNCWVYFPDTCRQCEDPACGNACPQKAIITNERISHWIPTSALAAVPAMMHAPGTCPPSTLKPAVFQVHRLRCLCGRLPVRRSVHRGLGCRHQCSTGCLHGTVTRNTMPMAPQDPARQPDHR